MPHIYDCDKNDDMFTKGFTISLIAYIFFKYGELFLLRTVMLYGVINEVLACLGEPLMDKYTFEYGLGVNITLPATL